MASVIKLTNYLTSCKRLFLATVQQMCHAWHAAIADADDYVKKKVFTKAASSYDYALALVRDMPLDTIEAILEVIVKCAKAKLKDSDYDGAMMRAAEHLKMKPESPKVHLQFLILICSFYLQWTYSCSSKRTLVYHLKYISWSFNYTNIL